MISQGALQAIFIIYSLLITLIISSIYYRVNWYNEIATLDAEVEETNEGRTFQSDRLVAISGIAKRLQGNSWPKVLNGPVDGQFLERLNTLLHWSVERTKPRRRSLDSSYIALLAGCVQVFQVQLKFQN